MESGVEAALTPHSHPPWIPVTCSIFLTSQRFWRRDQKICIDDDHPDQIDCAGAGHITASDCMDGNHDQWHVVAVDHEAVEASIKSNASPEIQQVLLPSRELLRAETVFLRPASTSFAPRDALEFMVLVQHRSPLPRSGR